MVSVSDPRGGSHELPPARRMFPAVAGPERADAAPVHLAWQREMERAQLAGWFRSSSGVPPAVAAAPPASAAAGPQAREGSDGQPVRRARPGLPEVVVSGATPMVGGPPPLVGAHASPASYHGLEFRTPGPRVMARPEGGVSYEASIARPSDVAVVGPGRSSPQAAPELTRSPDDGDTPDTAPHRAASEDPAPAPRLHLHEETTPWGQAIWVAIPGDEATRAHVLPGIVADLRSSLRAQGRLLHQVVCNGRLVWRDGHGLSMEDMPGKGRSVEPPRLPQRIHSQEP